ncbi:MAG TPA: hypothetical protein VNU66_07435 [Mycobacteriales bacterium]|nr:hypothetical protein [Mycobacteriales bacterium]
MTAPTTSPAAQRYLAEVAGELADLPVEERADLLEDLALHLAALDAEGDVRPVGVRLGTPAAYAAELRAAAGLPPAPPRPVRTGGRPTASCGRCAPWPRAGPVAR